MVSDMITDQVNHRLYLARLSSLFVIRCMALLWGRIPLQCGMES